MPDKNNIPKHVAIIMDGNGRWAKKRGFPRTLGHKAGIDRIKEIIRAADELNIKVLTFFAFSNENWARPASEVSLLIRYLNNFLDRQIDELNKKNIKFIWIGKSDLVPDYIKNKIRQAEEITKDNTGLITILAFNYGSRQEIIDAVKKFTQNVLGGRTRLEDLSAESFCDYFYTAGIPDPDLLIRTSGEMRLSNFLLWQLSYAELYFPKKYWPDFKKQDLEKAIKVYQNRERRFGAINAQDSDNA